MSAEPSYQDRVEQQREREAEQAAHRLASEQLLDSSQKKVENPEFLAQLTDPGFRSQKYGWAQEELPGLFARSNFLAERSESFEREAKFLNQNRAARKIIMHTPGRLTKAVTLNVPGAPQYPVLEIAQRVHDRSDKDLRKEMHTDDRAAIRQAGEVATNYQSNAIGGAGRKAVAESTAVSKVEKEEQTKSRAEKVASGVWG